MAEKEFNPVSPRVEHIVKGLFMVLFAVVVSINVGKVGRTLAFPFLYLFGASYYLIMGFIAFVGLYRTFRHKKLGIKDFLTGLGAVLLVLSLTLIVTFAFFKATGQQINNVNFNELLTSFNAQLGTYYSDKIINLFDGSNMYSCGLIGILVAGATANEVILLFIGVVLFLLAGLCLFWTQFAKLKKDRKSKEQRKAEREEAKRAFLEQQKLEEENNPVISKHEAAVYQDPIINHDTQIRPDPVFNRELEPAPVERGYESDDRPFINENSGFNQVGSSLDEVYGGKQIQKEDNNGYTEFTPLVFNSNVNSNPFERFSQPQVKPQEPVKEEPVAPEVQEEEEINLVEERPVETPIQPVQEERVINQELVKMQPQFIDPIEQKPAQPQNAPAPIVEPIIEKPKKRERVVWIAPSTDLLMNYETQEAKELNESVANERVILINKTLSDFKIGARCIGYTIGPSITRFNIEYDANVTVKSVERLDKDISLRLGGVVSRFAAIIPGESYSGLEVPNATITTVGFKDVFTALPDVKKHPLSVAFGKDISGNVIYADFNEFPHLLVAGTTGSGKSIYVHSIISTLIMRVSPDDLKIVLVDPKKVEMTKYRDMPHLLCPIITEADKAKVCLQKLVEEMERRYALFSTNPEISDIKGYNAWAKENNEETLPYIIVILDEYADLVDNCKEISFPVVSIAQKARSAGIHLLISTQRPSTNVITGVIKGNLPTHVALMTSSYTDSMTIIGEGGAETLLGKGDMLVQSPLVSRVGVTRLQGCYVQNKEIVHIVNYLKEHYETVYDPNFLDLVDHSKEPATPALAPGEVEKESTQEEENKYQSIKEWVMSQEFVSMSKIQRECSVGFNRAGRFFSRLQKEGVVAMTQDGSSKGCKVLVHDDYYDSDLGVGSDELIG